MQVQTVFYEYFSKTLLTQDKFLLQSHSNQNGETSFESLLNEANYSNKRQNVKNKQIKNTTKQTNPTQNPNTVLLKLFISHQVNTVTVNNSILQQSSLISLHKQNSTFTCPLCPEFVIITLAIETKLTVIVCISQFTIISY